MRFSVITPCFNGRRWIADTVRSIDAQRADVDVEHVVLDAGSTDGTREWLRAEAPHAQLVFERDRGQVDALRKGFDRATGDVFCWLNADDVFEAGALARVAAAFDDDEDAVAVTGPAIVIDGDGAVTGAIGVPADTTLAGLLRDSHNLAQPSTFFRRNAYRAVGGLDPNADLAMDVALWLRLARLGRIIALRDTPLSRFRVHHDARSVVAAGRAAREDLRHRRAAGMPLLSPAGLSLLRYGVVHPLLAPGWHRVRRLLRDLAP